MVINIIPRVYSDKTSLVQLHFQFVDFPPILLTPMNAGYAVDGLPRYELAAANGNFDD